jgi:hypothetical protein
MTNSIRFFTMTGCFMTLALMGVYAHSDDETSTTAKLKPAVQLTETDQKAVKEFKSDVDEYVQLHKKLADQLPKLPEKDATPEEINRHRAELATLIQKQRKDAKPGEFFTPAMVSLVKRAMSETLEGGEGKEIKKSIKDGAPVELFIAVNEKYPEAAPVSTMPVELLSTLPELDETVEYRFVSNRLVLVDAPAGVIIDMTPVVVH